MDQPTSYGRVPLKALVLSAAALAVPAIATLFFRTDFGDQQPLLWLLALIPAFLLAYYRGWRGAAVAIAGGMAVIAATHALALWFGQPLPDTALALPVIPIFLLVALGIGWTTELLHRRFSLAQESTLEATLVVTPDGVVRYASPSARSLLGQSRQALEGAPLSQFLSGAEGEPDLMPRLKEARDGDSIDVSVQQADGAVRLLNVLVQDRREVPALGGYVLRARDVTERRHADQQAQRAARMRDIGALAGVLAHDFNNLLTAIRGNADLLRDDLGDDPATRRGLAEIERAADRSGQLVEMLLAFTRQQVLRPRPLNLESILREAQPRLQEVLGADVETTVTTTDPLPHIHFDPVRLHRILLLLAARAKEAMSDGGRFDIAATAGEITDEAAHSFPYPVVAGDYVIVSVSDSGEPMPASAVESVFDPFAARLGPGSTGLELSSLYGTIKQAGGYVWASSDPRGTTFRMYLPVAVSPLPLLEADPAEPGSQARTILVVEDEPAVREVVRQTLLRRGYFVVEAEDGADALRILQRMQVRPDAVVTDLMMPKVGGRDLAAAITREYGPVPILYISGYAEDAVMAESLLAPGEVLLPKPFSGSQLVQAVEDVLKGAASAL
jgi:two-component system, cell cycle sensor histidine kinase and response regulator CckA